MTWDELRHLLDAGWHIGAHTHTHPNLSALSVQDPSGRLVRAEMDRNDELLERHLGVKPKDFAFTGTTWSRAAEDEVRKRYRFGRLWIIGAMVEADGRPLRFAELAGVAGPDQADGGPPHAARYVTEGTDAFRLPSMEIEALIFEFDAFRRYLEGARETG
jgi:peptidoglycan/xylan/chitin deacetylase (PgdA/CDA1 family)